MGYDGQLTQVYFLETKTPEMHTSPKKGRR